MVELIGFILGTAGKIMVAYTVVKVHYRVWKEHRIDEAVFQEMKRERRVALVGIAFMVVGFFMELPSRF